MYLSLLVPLDRSSFAEQALPLALSIARRADARLDRHAAHSEAAQRPAAVRGHHNQGECGRSARPGCHVACPRLLPDGQGTLTATPRYVTELRCNIRGKHP